MLYNIKTYLYLCFKFLIQKKFLLNKRFNYKKK